MERGMDTFESMERMVRLETKVDQLIEMQKNPPLSPLLEKEILKIEARFAKHEAKHSVYDEFQNSINQKIAWVAGVFAVIGAGGVALFKFFINLIQTGGPPNGP